MNKQGICVLEGKQLQFKTTNYNVYNELTLSVNNSTALLLRKVRHENYGTKSTSLEAFSFYSKEKHTRGRMTYMRAFIKGGAC